MLASNKTPFAAIGFEQLHRDGESMAVISVRGRYELGSDGSLRLADKQELVLADEYEGGPQDTPLLRVNDLIPFKPATDVTVLASAYPPSGRPAKLWYAGVMAGEHAHVLRIHGLRHWEPQGSGDVRSWQLSPVEEVARVTVDYCLASGGRVIGDPAQEIDPRNPLGLGLLDPKHSPEDRYPAPLIDTDEEPVADPFARPEPQGLGPVPPWWLWRQRHAGTYGERWLKERHPRLPEDFDYRFYQTAHPALVLNGYLRGDEVIRVVGLTPDGGRLAFTLPGEQPCALFSWTDGREVTARLNLDGLHIDLRKEPWRVDLTWRAWLAICPRFFKIDLFSTSLAEAEGLPVSREHGLAETEA